jgi:hypothetical protein
MADSSPETMTTRPRSRRLRDATIIGIVSATLLVASSPVAPPSPPVLPPERTRVLRRRVLGPVLTVLPPRLRHRLQLLSAPRGIAAAPSSRTASPALPTVGRPRDGPHRRRWSPANPNPLNLAAPRARFFAALLPLGLGRSRRIVERDSLRSLRRTSRRFQRTQRPRRRRLKTEQPRNLHGTIVSPSCGTESTRAI